MGRQDSHLQNFTENKARSVDCVARVVEVGKVGSGWMGSLVVN